MIITQETPDMNKENYMKSTTAWKDLWWLVGGRPTIYRPPTNHFVLLCNLFNITHHLGWIVQIVQ